MTIPVQFRIDEKLYEKVRQEARIRAAKEKKDISWQDLVREATAKMFENKHIKN